MVHTIFREVLQMSMASVFVIVVILIMRIFLKCFPRIFSYVLWSVLLIRLLIPFSFEVPYRAVSRQIIEKNIQEGDMSSHITQVEYSEVPMKEVKVSGSICSYIWIVGMIILVFYYFISYVYLRYRQ